LNIDFQPGRQQLDHETRQEMYDFINRIEAQPGPERNEDRALNNNPATLNYINNNVPVNDREDMKQRIKQQLPDTVKQLRKALNNNLTEIIFPPPGFVTLQDDSKQSFLLALQILKHQILTKNVEVTLTSLDPRVTPKRFYLNENSINLLNDALFQDNIPDVNDSNTEILSSYYIQDLASITFQVTPRTRPTRNEAGFFPFINHSKLNLERYAIYKTIDDKHLTTDSCLYTAIRESKVLSEEELNRLQHFITTRTFLLEDLPLICQEFNVNIQLHMYSDKTGKVNMRRYDSTPVSQRTIKLAVMFNHYMVDEKPDITSMPELGKQQLTIFTTINKLISMNLLVPMSDEQMINIISSFNKDDNMSYNHQRLVQIPDIKLHNNPHQTTKPKQGKFFFGYEPEENEIDKRLKELQQVINTLPSNHSCQLLQVQYSNAKDHVRIRLL